MRYKQIVTTFAQTIFLSVFTYRINANSYAINCNGSTAPRAVKGPLFPMTIGLGSSPSARLGLSVIIMRSAPRALTW